MGMEERELVDIKNIVVDTRGSVTARMKSYLAAVGDPYRFRVGKTRVSVVFSGREGGSLESELEKICMREG